MKTTFVHRTVRSAVVPIGAALRDHTLLRALLASRLGEDAARLLADPVVSSDGAYVDWYTEGLVEPIQLSRLPTEAQRLVEDKLAVLRDRVEQLAEETRARHTPRDLQMADSLHNIFEVPDPGCVFAVGDEPVLVAWAHRPADGVEQRVGLSVRVGRPRPIRPPASTPHHDVPEQPRVIAEPVTTPAPAAATPISIVQPAPPPEVTVRRGLGWLAWLLWLLFAALVIAILALLLRACALAPYLGWLGVSPYCGAGAAVDVASLQLIAADLEDQARRAAVPCEAITPVENSAVSEAESRTRGLQRGELEIALIWPTVDDLDLHVQFACGPTAQPFEIGYRQRGQTICGGMLDQDANVSTTSNTPAEHVVWINAEDIPPGEMNIVVHYYRDNGEPTPQVPYQVVITRGDAPPEVIEGSVTPGQIVNVTRLQN